MSALKANHTQQKADSNNLLWRKRALWALEDAIRDKTPYTQAQLKKMGLATQEQIDFGIECECFEFSVDGYLIQTAPVVEAMWLPKPEQVEEKAISKPLGTLPPLIPSLKLRNGEQPTSQDYWLFTGLQADTQLAESFLRECGVSCWAEPHGVNGLWKIIMPSFVTGDIQYLCLLEENEENV